MAVLQLIALGLVLHESVYLSSRGVAHWRENAAPVLGLRLGPGLSEAVHLSNVLASVTLLTLPLAWWTPILSLAILTLSIAAFPCRLPNHLMVAWFYLAAFVLAGIVNAAVHPAGFSTVDFALGAVQATTMLLYAIAGFHKLNADFFTPKRSCGAGFVVHYLLQRGVRLNRWPWYASPIGIYFVVMAELALPILLLVPACHVFGLNLALLLHVAFGFLAHLHFSIIMFAGLASFLPQESISALLFPHGLGWAPILVGAPMGLVLGNYLPYRHVELAKINHMAFGVLCVAMAISVARGLPGSSLAVEAFAQQPVAFCALLLAFFANGVAPYLGVKQDFSLAMFSNLRMDHWRHFIVARPLSNLSPRYVVVDQVVTRSGQRHPSPSFETRFLDRRRQMFAIGYVLDVLKEIQRESIEPLELLVAEATTGARLVLSPTDRTRLRRSERLSVFPYSLPLDPSTPVLS